MLITFLELRRTGDCNITVINMNLQHRVTPTGVTPTVEILITI